MYKIYNNLVIYITNDIRRIKNTYVENLKIIENYIGYR